MEWKSVSDIEQETRREFNRGAKELTKRLGNGTIRTRQEVLNIISSSKIASTPFFNNPEELLDALTKDKIRFRPGGIKDYFLTGNAIVGYETYYVKLEEVRNEQNEVAYRVESGKSFR
ncbi:hypothetical protein COU54_05565 [Candidatus Pacearchaeota archaeon CG10_big_fil_rev_8_21_14_0_10_31_24]|nr:MAG: hypothetical protein COU54_05565 [Candidatus Pacearchaeota archaeon CG10_big_fil_rev_8_21_14_0_10_31_24]